jgi:membrane fusion protein (multidrug efflux system)
VARIQEVANETASFKINLEGTLKAYNKVSIFSQVPGLLEQGSAPFKVGNYFSKGDALFRINNEEATLALLAQKSELLSRVVGLLPDIKLDFEDRFQEWRDYVDSFDVEQVISDFPAAKTSREKSFIAAKNLSTSLYSIRSAENRLEKYAIRAPFSGVLTMTNANKGAMVQPGQMLGEFMERGNFELIVSVLASDIKYLQRGQEAEFYSEDMGRSWKGKIVRVSDKINPQSQTLDVYIQLRGKELKEGLFLSGLVVSKPVEDVFLLDNALLVGQDEAYAVKDGVLEKMKLDIVRISDSGILVRDIPNGTWMLGKQISGAFEGMEVNVSEPSID